MEMIPSEISGVLFSLNPTNNDYDEVIINSNWGVGETVVSGVIEPDFFIVNKRLNLIINKKLGKKEYGLFLKDNGGLEEIHNDEKSNLFSLKEENIMLLMKELKKIEKIYYDIPIDIEWCFFNQKLFILQARPITTYLKLPKKLLTNISQKRNLYLDVSLVVQGADKPYSTLGSSLLNFLFYNMGMKVFGSSDFCDIHNGIIEVIGGRILINLSNFFTKVNKKNWANAFRMMNPKVSDIILNLCETEEILDKNFTKNETEENKIKRLTFNDYVNPTIPPALNFSKLGMLWRMPVTKFLFGYFFLNRIKNGIANGTKRYSQIIASYDRAWQEKRMSLKGIIERLFSELSILIIQCILPGVYNGFFNGIYSIKNMFENPNILYNQEEKSQLHLKNNLSIDNILREKVVTKNEMKFLIENLVKSLPNNITTTMGLDLFNLAEILYNNNRKKGDLFSKITFDEFIFYFKNINEIYMIKTCKKNYTRTQIYYEKEYLNNQDSMGLEFHEFINENFLTSYNEFIDIYGIRGESELDIKNPRYRENPRFILSQIFEFYESLVKNGLSNNIVDNCNLNHNDNIQFEEKHNNLNPKEIFLEADYNRAKIYEKLLEIAEFYGFSSEFRKAYQLAINLAGYRETPKYYVIKTLSFLREIFLEIAQVFLDFSIIEYKDEIFQLKYTDIIDIYENRIPKIEVFDKKNKNFKNELTVEENMNIKELFLANLKAEIKSLKIKNNNDSEIFLGWHTCPDLFDSRGKILKSDNKKVKAGEIVGDSVSFGVVKGKVKVMKTADEKKFENGDILVTKATDPGWTPLIINSGGIILEVGGMLQHGALVAREFSKPCIVGVENAMQLFKDDEIVQIDAYLGIIKKL